MIACKDIGKSFWRQTVLEGLSYEFNNTGFYLLFGESGSGKTTFLNLLAGFLPFEEGRIDWNGRVYENQVERDEVSGEFDYITQDSFFVDFLTVRENLALICEDESRIMSTLARFGIKEKAPQYPPTLSGGERQRLALARAVIKGKKVLFLDEPTAALDGENKLNVFRLLSELSKDMLVICSSHDAAAKSFADEIVTFAKSEKTGKGIRRESSVKVKRMKKDEGKAPPMKYLKKYFKFRRKVYLSILYSVFLIFSICMCVLADLPDNKTESALEHMYRLNLLTVGARDGTTLKDILPEGDERVRQAVMSYSGSCPISTTEPNEGGMFEMLYDDIDIIPASKEAFRLADKLKYGKWFENKFQVIIDARMAEVMSPGNHEALLGRTLSRNLYGYGVTDFEIVGIFGQFTELECKYLNAAGIQFDYESQFIDPNEDPAFYAAYLDEGFFSSELTESFEDDAECFYGPSDQRTYYLYFDSFRDMKSFYNDMSERFAESKKVSFNYDFLVFEHKILFITLFRILVPMSLLLALFSAMFYIELKKTEFVYNSSFISVFEYSGYSKKKTVGRFIWLNILQYLKIFAVSALISFAITYTVNLLNFKYHFVTFQIFTYNIPMIAGFLFFNVAMILIFTNIFFRKVKVRSWYENLIAQRDLI